MEVLKSLSREIETFRNSVDTVKPPKLGYLLRSEKPFLVGLSFVGIGGYICIGTIAAGAARTFITGESISTYNPPEIAVIAAIANATSGLVILGGSIIANKVNSRNMQV